MQVQAVLSSGLVGLGSIIIAGAFQWWLELLEKRKSVHQTTKGSIMKTKIQRQTKTTVSRLITVATAKTVVSVLTGLAGSCLLP